MDKDKQVKQIIFGENVRKKILEGVDITARAVSTTFGSRGRNVALEENWGIPNIIHDGVTVAKKVVLKDPFANQAAQLVIHAAQKTNDEAGDGTTSATIITDAIVKEGIKLVSSGVNPMIIRKGIEEAVALVVTELKRISKPVKTYAEMEQVATISAADPDMGKLIATAIQKVGEHGVVTVQEGTSSSVEVEYKEGIDFNKGYLSPYLVTNPERMEAVMEGETTDKRDDAPHIAIVNEKLNNERLLTILNTIYHDKPEAQTLIIADDFESDAQATILLNRLRFNKMIIAVKSPEFGDHRINLLNDMTVITGGNLIGGSTGIPFDNVKPEDIGRAGKVMVYKDQTIIVAGKGDKKKIEERTKAIKKMLEEVKNEFEKDKLEVRLSKIVGGVAVVNVGAPSETEMKEKKERAIDAVNATKAAILEGIVPGGGVAFLRGAKVLDKANLPEELMIGVKIIKEALYYPFKKLVENAGVKDSGIILGEILKSDNENIGYNVDTEKIVDLIESGIIDPVKVSRSALQNAASVATMLLTTESMIVFDRGTKEKTDDINGAGKFID